MMEKDKREGTSFRFSRPIRKSTHKRPIPLRLPPMSILLEPPTTPSGTNFLISNNPMSVDSASSASSRYYSPQAYPPSAYFYHDPGFYINLQPPTTPSPSSPWNYRISTPTSLQFGNVQPIMPTMPTTQQTDVSRMAGELLRMKTDRPGEYQQIMSMMQTPSMPVSAATTNTPAVALQDPPKPKKRPISTSAAPVQLSKKTNTQASPLVVDRVKHQSNMQPLTHNLIVSQLEAIKLSLDMVFLTEHEARFTAWAYCQFTLRKCHEVTTYGDLAAYRCYHPSCSFKINFQQFDKDQALSTWRLVEFINHSADCTVGQAPTSDQANRLFSRRTHKHIGQYMLSDMSRKGKAELCGKVLTQAYTDRCSVNFKSKTWNLAIDEYEKIPSSLQALWCYFGAGDNAIDLLK